MTDAFAIGHLCVTVAGANHSGDKTVSPLLWLHHITNITASISMSGISQLDNPQVHISSHPLVASKLTQLRLHDLGAKDFREGIKSIGCVAWGRARPGERVVDNRSMLVYEASRNLPLAAVPNVSYTLWPDAQSSFNPQSRRSPGRRSPFVSASHPFCVLARDSLTVSHTGDIVCSQLILAALELFPDATVLHLGLFRDKVTLQAIEWVSTSWPLHLLTLDTTPSCLPTSPPTSSSFSTVSPFAHPGRG